MVDPVTIGDGGNFYNSKVKSFFYVCSSMKRKDDQVDNVDMFSQSCVLSIPSHDTPEPYTCPIGTAEPNSSRQKHRRQVKESPDLSIV